jgi:DNA repair exonuclease SbcCD ATPase subunit
VPLVNIDIPGVEQIETGAQQLKDLQTQIEEGGDNVERLSQTTQELVGSLTTGFADLESSVTALMSALPEFEARIIAYQERLANLKPTCLVGSIGPLLS